MKFPVVRLRSNKETKSKIMLAGIPKTMKMIDNGKDH